MRANEILLIVVLMVLLVAIALVAKCDCSYRGLSASDDDPTWRITHYAEDGTVLGVWHTPSAPTFDDGFVRWCETTMNWYADPHARAVSGTVRVEALTPADHETIGAQTQPATQEGE